MALVDMSGPSSDSGLGGSGANEGVGVYMNVDCKVSNAHCWGENPLVINAPGGSGANLIGSEIDVANNQVSARGFGLYIKGGSSQSGNYNGIDIEQLSSGFTYGPNAIQWQRGLYLQAGSSVIGLEIGQDQAGTAGRGSMPFDLDWADSSSRGYGLDLKANTEGNFALDTNDYLSGWSTHINYGALQVTTPPLLGCNAANEGAMYYDRSIHHLEVCTTDGAGNYLFKYATLN